MSLANPTEFVDAGSINRDELELLEFVQPHAEWFISEDGRLPLEVNRNEFDFSVAHGRLIFSCWTQRGARASRVTDWNRSGDKLVLQVSRRMGAEVATIELVPRASAKALVATIAAARQARCEALAQLVAQTLGVGGRVLGANALDLNSLSLWERGGVRGEAETIVSPHPNPLPKGEGIGQHPNPYAQHPAVKIERAALSPGMR